jgi:hypothetical protein
MRGADTGETSASLPSGTGTVRTVSMTGSTEAEIFGASDMPSRTSTGELNITGLKVPLSSAEGLSRPLAATTVALAVLAA